MNVNSPTCEIELTRIVVVVPLLQPGDVVYLKSGGSPMTVGAIESQTAMCLWHTEEGHAQCYWFPLPALRTQPEGC